VIWFTLGNISVEGTYYTHGLNLTPRGLLAVTVADTVADGLDSAPYGTVRRSRRVGSPSGTGIPVMVSPNRINKPPNDKAKAPRIYGQASRLRSFPAPPPLIY
jgi:hypothetical protein